MAEIEDLLPILQNHYQMTPEQINEPGFEEFFSEMTAACNAEEGAANNVTCESENWDLVADVLETEAQSAGIDLAEFDFADLLPNNELTVASLAAWDWKAQMQEIA